MVGGAPNVISGNGQAVTSAGIRVFGDDVIDLEIINNIIGLSAAGDLLVPNNGSGILVHGNASGVQIGLAGAGNFIAGAGNTHASIRLDTGSTDNTIQGNVIGLAVDGSSLIGGAVTAASHLGLSIQDSPNLIGGTGFGDGNTIRDMATGGIEAEPGNTILGNSIFNSDDGSFADDFLGIDIEPDGITTTNLPVIDLAVSGFATTRAGGTLTATPETRYRIEVFASSAVGVTGFGEGETFLGFVDVVTDSIGEAVWSFSTDTLTSVGEFISATATSNVEGTSEFAFSVATRASLVVRNTNDVGADSLRQHITTANANAGGDLIEFDIPGAGPHIIQPLSVLPLVTTQVLFDGRSEPDYGGAPIVQIDGSLTPAINGPGFRYLKTFGSAVA